jgi:hypothetical protein
MLIVPVGAARARSRCQNIPEGAPHRRSRSGHRNRLGCVAAGRTVRDRAPRSKRRPAHPENQRMFAEPSRSHADEKPLIRRTAQRAGPDRARCRTTSARTWTLATAFCVASSQREIAWWVEALEVTLARLVRTEPAARVSQATRGDLVSGHHFVARGPFNARLALPLADSRESSAHHSGGAACTSVARASRRAGGSESALP